MAARDNALALRSFHVYAGDAESDFQPEKRPPMEFVSFAQESVLRRCTKSIWSTLAGSPAVESRPSIFGQRIAVREDAADIAVVSRDAVKYYALVEGRGAVEEALPSVLPDVYCVRFRPNGFGDFAAGTDDGVFLFHKRNLVGFSTKWTAERLGTHAPTALDCLDFDPTGLALVAGGPTVAGFYVYEVINQTVRQHRRAFERVNDLRYSPCGTYILTVCDCRWVFVWNAVTWTVMAHFGDCNSIVHGIHWGPRKAPSCFCMATATSPDLAFCWTKFEAGTVCRVFDGGSAAYVSCQKEGETVNCVKCLCWDVTGQTLAVLLDNPHPRVGSVALFQTKHNQTHFLQYIDLGLSHNLADKNFHASMSHRIDGVSVEFVVYTKGTVACFAVPLDGV